MIGVRFAWLRRAQTYCRREAAYLPKPVVLFTLPLLVLYLFLLIHTEQQVQHAYVGFVEASMQSKLTADYERAEQPTVPFAPLDLEVLQAKIQDENPYSSTAEVAAMVQTAIAAASAPIVVATPTAPFYTQVVIQAAVVVRPQLAFRTPMVMATSTQIGLSSVSAVAAEPTLPVTPIVAGVSEVALASPTNDALDAITNDVQPTALTANTGSNNVAVIPELSMSITPSIPQLSGILVAGTPTWGDDGSIQQQPSGATQPLLRTPVPDTPVAPLLPRATNTAASSPAIDHMAASQPEMTATPTPPSPTALPTATWLALPTAIPSPSWTATATVAAGDRIPLPSVPTLSPTATALVFVTSPTLSATATPMLRPTATLLPAITNLIARIESDQVFLEWPPYTDAPIVGYNLYRSATISEGVGVRINGAPLHAATYVDTVPLNGQHYFYQVTAIDQENQESPPGEAAVVTTTDELAPRRPSTPFLSLNGNEIQVGWQANPETDLAGYRVYRGIAWPARLSAELRNSATLVTTRSYTDSVISDGRTYYYVLTAVDLAGNESPTSFESQMSTIDWTAPDAPTGLIATLEGYEHESAVQLSWQATNESNVSYRLYRAQNLPVDTTGLPLHEQPLLTTFYEDKTVQENTHYYYVVVAVDARQNISLPSQPAEVTTAP